MNRQRPGIALIGFGWIGQSHTHAYRNLPVYFPESDIQPRLVAWPTPRPSGWKPR